MKTLMQSSVGSMCAQAVAQVKFPVGRTAKERSAGKIAAGVTIQPIRYRKAKDKETVLLCFYYMDVNLQFEKIQYKYRVYLLNFYRVVHGVKIKKGDLVHLV